ncbi:MAG: hypothetical protein ACRD5K_15400 [Candidatus Acidiferrales bacterium]
MKVLPRLAVLAALGFTFTAAAHAQPQNKAAVEMEKPDAIHAGGPISFLVRLNEPLPKGAHFDLRISPISADEEIPLGSGTPVSGSNTEFRVTETLPKDAIPGEWHISVIWLFLPGAGWTHTSIAPNDLRFKVEGKTYPIPTRADVTLDK